MKEIPLSRGKVTLVDDEDFEWINQWKWHCSQQYAARTTPRPEHRKILMHRVIMQTPNGMQTDHIDHNGLDNQRENLRICTVAENQRNRKADSDNASGFKGVYFSRKRHKWYAQITVDRKNMHLGSFDSPEEAARFYDLAALAYHGEFARTNF